MFDSFTDMAHDVIVTAKSHVTEFGHAYIGTEHVLLALTEVEDGIAAKALTDANVTSLKVREQLLALIGDGQTSKSTEPNFTPRMKRVLEIAYRQTLQMGNKFVSTEHILLGILIEGEGVALKILDNIGLSVNDIRKALATYLGGNSGAQDENVMAESGGKRSSQSGAQLIDKFARNLTAAAREGKLDPVIGRKTEVERVTQILSRRTKNNPILIGEPGVGKTAVVEGLAQSIVAGDVPETIINKEIYALDLGAMVAGTTFRGQFEDRIKKVMSEIRARGNILLFIDEIHTLVGAGNAEGALDASSILKPMLARGELQTIGATTLDEFRKYFEKDAALERRFQPIQVPEPTIPDAIEILKGLRDRYEAHHRVTITDDAIEVAVKLSSRYVNDRFLPDKAIDLIDEAGAKLRIQKMTQPPEIRDLTEQLTKKKLELEAAVKAEDFTSAAQLQGETDALNARCEEAEKKWKAERDSVEVRVDAQTIAQVLEMATGVPVNTMTEEETKRLMKMEDGLHKRVIGQNEAISALSRSIRRTRAGLKDPKRPSGSFIFAGPTGVGKTELAKALAEFLFGDESALLQVDMSEYSEKHEVSKLFGAPPGFVGYEDGGQLTEKVRRKPFSVVLFDEIEKAHPDIFNSLLQVLEDGHLTDSTGRLVNFKNTVIIMTTNLGSADLARGISVGFSDDSDQESSYEHMKAKVREDLKKNFRPEFLNRLDDIIVFPQLTRDEILQIVELMIGKLAERLNEKGMQLKLTDAAKQLLADKGYDSVLGARPLRRVITNELEDVLSEKILYDEMKEGDLAVFDVLGKEFKLTVKHKE